MTNVVSSEAVPSLDYLSSAFRPPSYDARIAETRYEYFYPISGTKNTTSLRWSIPHNNGNYVSNMQGLILALDPKITDRECLKTPPLDIKSAPCNNFCNSIFSSLRICYNTTCVLKLDNYPIYNITRMLLNCNNDDFNTWCETRCFYPDKEDEDLDDIDTKSWDKRRKQFGGVINVPQYLEDGTTANP